MILKTLTAALLFLAIQSVLAEEPKQENKAPQLVNIFPKNDVNGISLIDGQLLVFSGYINTIDANAEYLRERSTCFELRDTPKG
jgi:hypothetical protein